MSAEDLVFGLSCCVFCRQITRWHIPIKPTGIALRRPGFDKACKVQMTLTDPERAWAAEWLGLEFFDPSFGPHRIARRHCCR